MTVFVDLDGVLANFDKHMFKLTGKYPNEMQRKDVSKTLDAYKHTYFKNLELMPDAMKLWNYLISNFPSVKILTAFPRKEIAHYAEIQKQDWVAKYLGNNVEVLFGPFSKDKKNHCKSSRDILIDDREKNVSDWISVGGIGILFTDVDSTINKLKEIKKNELKESYIRHDV